MNLSEFLDQLRATEVEWRLSQGVDLRCARGDCPITAVAFAVMHEEFDPDSWEVACEALGMDHKDAQAIVDAADLNDDYDTDLRNHLLAATVGREKGNPS